LGGVTSPLRQDVKKKVDSTKKDGGRKETREVWVFPTRTLEDVKKMMMAEDLPREVERKLGVEDTNQHSDSLPKLVDAAPSSEVCVCVCFRVCVFWEGGLVLRTFLLVGLIPCSLVRTSSNYF